MAIMRQKSCLERLNFYPFLDSIGWSCAGGGIGIHAGLRSPCSKELESSSLSLRTIALNATRRVERDHNFLKYLYEKNFVFSPDTSHNVYHAPPTSHDARGGTAFGID